MAYRNFTLETVRKAFQLEADEAADISADLEPMDLSAHLTYIPRIYGAATTGTMWHFLKLEGQQLYIDKKVYSIGQCDKILGILASMVEQKA